MRSKLLTYAGAVLSVLAAVALAHAAGVLPSVGGGSSYPGGADPPTEQAGPEPGPAVAPSGDPALGGIEQLAQAFDQGSTPVVRTEFGDDEAWQLVVDEVSRPVDGFPPFVTAVESGDLAGATGATLADEATSGGFMHGYAILVDARSMAEARAGGELTVDYVDLSPYAAEDAELFDTFPGRTFRCAVTQIASVEANLSIANLDFSDFANVVDPDGVYRG